MEQTCSELNLQEKPFGQPFNGRVKQKSTNVTLTIGHRQMFVIHSGVRLVHISVRDKITLLTQNDILTQFFYSTVVSKTRL